MGASQLLPISLGIHLLAGYAIRRGLYRRTVDAGGRFRGVFSSASANVICRSGPRWATSNLHGWRAKPRCWLQLQRLCTALMLHQTYATPGAIANDRFRVNTALQTYKSHLPIRSHREDRAVRAPMKGLDVGGLAFASPKHVTIASRSEISGPTNLSRLAILNSLLIEVTSPHHTFGLGHS